MHRSSGLGFVKISLRSRTFSFQGLCKHLANAFSLRVHATQIPSCFTTAWPRYVRDHACVNGPCLSARVRLPDRSGTISHAVSSSHLTQASLSQHASLARPCVAFLSATTRPEPVTSPGLAERLAYILL